MNTTRTLIHVAAVLTLAAAAMPAAHANTTAEGVKCPTGTSARLSNSDRKLVCETEERVERASVCSPLVFKNNGDVNLNTRIEPVQAGSDSCVARNTAGAVIATQPSQALFLPGDDPTQFRREVRPGADAWPRRRPTGSPSAARSTWVMRPRACPARPATTATSSFGGQGLRCDRRELRKAMCDIGWTMGPQQWHRQVLHPADGVRQLRARGRPVHHPTA